MNHLFNTSQPNAPFIYLPKKRQKTFRFLTFLGGIEMEHWAKTGEIKFLESPCFNYKKTRVFEKLFQPVTKN